MTFLSGGYVSFRGLQSSITKTQQWIAQIIFANQSNQSNGWYSTDHLQPLTQHFRYFKTESTGFSRIPFSENYNKQNPTKSDHLTPTTCTHPSLRFPIFHLMKKCPKTPVSGGSAALRLHFTGCCIRFSNEEFEAKINSTCGTWTFFWMFESSMVFWKHQNGGCLFFVCETPR